MFKNSFKKLMIKFLVINIKINFSKINLVEPLNDRNSSMAFVSFGAAPTENMRLCLLISLHVHRFRPWNDLTYEMEKESYNTIQIQMSEKVSNECNQ